MAPKRYEAQDIAVSFDPRRCIHAAVCGTQLGAVFDINKRPWIQPDQAAVEDVVRVVEACPSGALTYERLDGGAQEIADPEVSVRVAPSGPLLVRGTVTLTGPSGEEIEVGPRVALCRCGASTKKPFCDNTHSTIGFAD